jgi:hypothetical protein
MGEREQRIGLRDLAEELTRRNWVAHVRRRGKGPVLEVTNPEVGNTDERLLTEVITCQDAPGSDGLAYGLPGGQTIGLVTDVETAADQIQHVLRSVGQ